MCTHLPVLQCTRTFPLPVTDPGMMTMTTMVTPLQVLLWLGEEHSCSLAQPSKVAEIMILNVVLGFLMVLGLELWSLLGRCSTT
jgi:hypothetical protein